MASTAPYIYQSDGLTTSAGNSDALNRKTKELLPPGKLKILEVGCGNGLFSKALAALGHEVVGLDTSETGIALARKAETVGCRFEVASAYDDLRPLVDKVDCILALEVIEHLYAPKQFLKNAHEALKPGGHIILSTPYHGYLKNLALSLLGKWDSHHGVDWDGGHIKFFSTKTLTELLETSGFAKLKFNNFGRVPYLWKSMLVRAERTTSPSYSPMSVVSGSP